MNSWGFWCVTFIVVVVLLNRFDTARERKKRDKARRQAHTPPPMPNIYGGSREATRKDLKAKGWIK